MRSIDLTNGPIVRNVFCFALPLLGSSLIQQMYSTVDLIFAGHFLDKNAAPAIGSGGIVITLIIGFFTGLSTGTGVIAGQLRGADDKAALKRLVYTVNRIAAVLSIVLTIAGIILTPVFVDLMNTPELIIPDATLYMRLYFLSMPSIVFFNISSGVVRACGDSVSPLRFQFFGGIANIAGNAFFILVLKLGVAGVAMTTILSQTTAMIFNVRCMMRYVQSEDMKSLPAAYDGKLAKDIFRLGIPSAIQAMLLTFSNVIIQASINTIGVDSIAAFTAYYKVENFIYYPIMAVGQANAVFASQNYGAGKIDRMREGLKRIVFWGSVMTISIEIIVLIFRKQFFLIFIEDFAAIEIGCKMVLRSFPFYFLYVFLEAFVGSIRACGNAVAPMAASIINICGIRLLLIYLVMQFTPTAPALASIYPITWATSVITLFVLYIRQIKKIEVKKKEYGT